MIPSAAKCLELMEEYEMMEHIRAHSIMVEKVARIIARGLQGAGLELSIEKVTAGALMHDISKTHCLAHGGDHAALGRQVCLENRFHEIADIVGEHVRLKAYHEKHPIQEKEIVYYADKRVNHDQTVSLEDRLRYLLVRYGNREAHLCRLIEENFDLCRRVEKKIFIPLIFKPEDVAEMVADRQGGQRD